jgi:hypothetical protein
MASLPREIPLGINSADAGDEKDVPILHAIIKHL